MKYISTRGDKTERGFCDILLEGLAPDGGLYLPAHYPHVDGATLASWRGLPYAELAFRILSLYIDDIPPVDLRVVRGQVQPTIGRQAFQQDLAKRALGGVTAGADVAHDLAQFFLADGDDASAADGAGAYRQHSKGRVELSGLPTRDHAKGAGRHGPASD